MSKPKLPNVVRPPILPIFGRVLTLFTALCLCAAVACTWWAKGITWIFDAGNGGALVLLECPRDIYTFAGKVPEGDFCQLSLNREPELMTRIDMSGLFQHGQCIRPTNNEDPIICNLDSRCADVCQMVDGSGVCKSGKQLPPTPMGLPEPLCNVVLGFDSTLAPVMEQIDCRSVLHGSYCDSDFEVTSSNTLAMRGFFSGILILTLIWLLAEWVLRCVDIDLRVEKAVGMARMAQELPEKRAILRKSLEERWRQESQFNASPSPLSNCDDFEPSSPPAWVAGSPSDASVSVATCGPARRFSSPSWRRRLAQWRKLRAEKTNQFQAKLFLRTLLLNVFFVALMISTFYIIIMISPQNISVVESWDKSVMGKMSVWILESWVDYLIFADVFLDTGMFLIATIAVKWPKAPVFSRHIQDRIAAATNKAERGDNTPVEELDYSVSSSAESVVSGSAGSVSFILDQAMSVDTCLMIACHCSTMTVERCATFSNTLRAALAVFPPHHIFVCDNGPTMHPQDATQFVAKQVHPDINYLYVPEGNKTFAFYWCNKYWIPTLSRAGICPNFAYSLIIDDDVPLPPDLHIPHEHLRKDLTIKAVHFPITATTPDGNPPALVRCQDIEYKLAAVHKLFQASMSRSLSCHGAIALWDRDAMAEVFTEHDTVFNGEDLYMGLCLLRKRDSSKIISCAQTIVPTYAPDTWAVLFRQRVKSWELTSHKKSFTFLMEIINPVSFCHGASLCLKPYFIQELLTVLLDWLRIFLLMGLLLRDSLGLLLMTAFFTIILYGQLLLFQFVVLRDRKDLRSTFTTVLLFPFYKLCNLFFRVCALCQNMLVYSHERKGIKISVREDEIRDIPPTPPHCLVDWFTIWEEPELELERVKSAISRTRSATGIPSRFRM